MIKLTFFSFACLTFAASSIAQNLSEKNMKINPPKAEKIVKNLEAHGDVRVDNYYWLNNPDDPKVIDYLKAENDYYEKMTDHTKKFKEDLFEEMKARIKEDDESVPYKLNGYYYITRYEKGQDYPIYSRKKGSLDAKEEILFNVNEMAKGYSFYNLGGMSVSEDNKLVSFGVDTLSRRKYDIYIKNLETGEIYPEMIPLTTGGSTWGSDNKTLFYTRKDEKTLRADRIYRHTLGTDPKTDELIFSEDDDTFGTYVFKTKSRQFIVIGSYSTLTSEYRVLPANDPTGKFKVFQKRERGLEYNISHYGDNWYVMTNKDKAQNFKLMKTSLDKTSKENWVDMIPHRTDVLLEDFDIFKDYLVVSERNNGLTQLRIKRWDNKDDYYLPFDNETYTAFTTQNPEFDTKILRYGYNALNTPSSIIDFNMETKEKTILKETEVLGGKFDKNNYVSERLWATAKDGKKIPISLISRRGIKKDGSNPLLIYGYGSYGSTIDPYFSSVRLSLLDRGFIFAIAHVRGGEYLGRQWYEDGKLLNKINTFTDFIAASEYLVELGYTSPNHLYASGGSAGGLLMGAIANLAPNLYNGIIASVPFVDVLTTMLDDSIPLTTGEYDEWGNPNDLEYYNYIKSYSPYDNVERKSYPNLLVTTGLHDSQVQYYEPAKWVAKLRDMKTGKNTVLFHTNMEAGHGGASGRFESLKEVAMDYAFLLDLEGIKE
ncbi:S9 family peptidase [Aequorivita sp. H23M31]|uniref:Proline-specific endopeptidase n=1 Tax=Aequorivita ciconiae TaxID=2494375 RepID=A0A410G163_9FLAO|nr:S9 family peptidase [Aequorivita sp. H23M31]QAA81014.1 S9 family peptidase [Aequorivita sp. H23M31]